MSLPALYGPFLLLQRLEDPTSEAFRARRTAAGGLGGPVRLLRPRRPERGLGQELSQQAAYGARLAHPSVVRVLEVGLMEGELYAVTEIAEGVDLRAALLACRARGTTLPVQSCLAIGLQLARIATELHEKGRDVLLGHLRPEDVVLGWDGRVRVRARGVHPVVERKQERDPFLAPELARGGAPSPQADCWTLGRILRATLATDAEGRKTPKVSAAYRDTLGPVLVEALARTPEERVDMRALEACLGDLLARTEETPAQAVADICAELFPGGALALEELEEPLTQERVRALLAAGGPPAVPELLFPRPGATPEEDFGATRVGARPAEIVGEGPGTSLFDRILSEHERVPAGAAGDLSAGEADALAVQGTVRAERPASLAPSGTGGVFREDGGVFAGDAAPPPEPVDHDEAPTARAPVPRFSEREPGDVFTGTVRPAELLPELNLPRSGGKETQVMRKRSSLEPPDEDPARTAFLERPHLAPDRDALVAPQDEDDDDDDDESTHRIPMEVARAVAAAARAGSADWGGPMASESPQRTSLLPVHDVREVLSRGHDDEGDPRTLDEVLPDDPELGIVVIDAPDDAVVFVNGEQRGVGRTVVHELDRFTTYQIRVHLRGYRPWSGTVMLQGLRAARVEPELQPR